MSRLQAAYYRYRFRETAGIAIAAGGILLSIVVVMRIGLATINDNTVVEYRVADTTITQNYATYQKLRSWITLCAEVEGKTVCAMRPQGDWLPKGQPVRVHYGVTRSKALAVEYFTPLAQIKKSR